jgi:hypothetical protein
MSPAFMRQREAIPAFPIGILFRVQAFINNYATLIKENGAEDISISSGAAWNA